MATSKFEQRPWGNFQTFEDDKDDRYWVKKLTVNPGQTLSLQRHQSREEFWVCVDGVLTTEINDKKKRLMPGEFVHIKKGDIHRASNEQEQEAVFMEVATGKCLEHDNERLEDKYGRS